MNDIAGGHKPLDKSYQGQDATISGDMTRWSEDVFRAMQARPNFSGTRGLNPGGDLGSFMVQEGFAFPIWLQYPYAAKAAMNGLPQGYRFLQGWLEGPDSLEPGTMPYKIRCLWYAIAVHLPDANNSIRAMLYDHNMQNLPAIT